MSRFRSGRLSPPCALLLVALTGCRPQTGGNSGSEGMLAPCEETATTLSLDAVGDAVGFSARDLLDLAALTPQVSMRWEPRDSGPELKEGDDTLTVIVEPHGDAATQLECQDPSYPEEYRPEPRLELPVTLTLRTEDGTLDERLETTLIATKGTLATIDDLTLEPEALRGALGAAVAEYYGSGDRSLTLQLMVTANGIAGAIDGPLSPSTTNPCAYAATYAIWPIDAECWPELDPKPISDDAMQEYLDRVSRSFELTWDEGDTTVATFSVALAEGRTCAQMGYEPGAIRHRVEVHVTTADGRLDLSSPATLIGGPSHHDLTLDGAVALDGEDIVDQLGDSGDAASAAITTLGLWSDSDASDLSGFVLAVAVDRTGFATPLPTGELIGDSAARCYDSAGEAGPRLLRGRISVR